MRRSEHLTEQENEPCIRRKYTRIIIKWHLWVVGLQVDFFVFYVILCIFQILFTETFFVGGGAWDTN